MSLSTFCLTCGSPNYYTTEKPRFCSNCGRSFGSTSISAELRHNRAISRAATRTKSVSEEDNDELDDENLSVPKNIKWQYSMSNVKYSGIKMTDFIKQAQSPITDAPLINSTPKDKDEILKEFYNEAKSPKRLSETSSETSSEIDE